MVPKKLKKMCAACRKRLSAAAFNDSARSADGLAKRCRACTNARRRQLAASRGTRRRPTANLATALRAGDIRKVRQYIRTGATPHWAWICETMRSGHLALAEMLVATGVQHNVFTLTALGDARALARELTRRPTCACLTADLDPNSQGVTPLHVACALDWRGCEEGRLEAQVTVVQLLHQHDADLNATARYRGIDEATPLFCACWSSANLPLVRWLLDHGAMATDRDFGAALGHFQRHGKPAYDIAETLLAWGLPVDGSVPGERTPLQAFAHQGVHRTVAWLIAHGADVRARGPGGRTAAHLAAERNTGPRTLALLAAAGADLSARDDDGHTPLDLARLNGKARVAAWLSERS